MSATADSKIKLEAEAVAEPSAAQKMIKVKTKDGDIFEIEEKVAMVGYAFTYFYDIFFSQSPFNIGTYFSCRKSSVIFWKRNLEEAMTMFYRCLKFRPNYSAR